MSILFSVLADEVQGDDEAEEEREEVAACDGGEAPEGYVQGDRERKNKKGEEECKFDEFGHGRSVFLE